MQTVRDADGDTYLLVKRSAESSRVRDPATGAERYVDNDELSVVDGESPLATAASGVPSSVRKTMRAVHDDRSLGLLAVVVDEGPLPVIELLDATELCESDLHGTVTELRAAGLIAEVDVDGRRGYAATDDASEAIELLRGGPEADIAAGRDRAEGG
ncbi:hypothetical protein DJ82_03830 [Halorubrum sp. Ib24]|uniref:DUF7346 family protein n=1 Tax=unclassified Halorubrum TaxID=2642239 RepID=UPI000B98EDB7|nr:MULTISPECIES: hypothetical protein [unclassified Halorubrum]OYR42011.1 hypothetical protein DJ82_03830 [Halorubrum sp. Ib24]OYR46858.1 hypothetical protein DJ81_02025 [Halorubrum sp. Hd13]OYR46882.1 hypothetical protein DJ74_13965 [Halorubrum sp. Ea8]OYR54736.1 hypothetical protein DJ73_04360 [Halorubrum sp. Ea1]